MSNVVIDTATDTIDYAATNSGGLRAISRSVHQRKASEHLTHAARHHGEAATRTPDITRRRHTMLTPRGTT